MLEMRQSKRSSQPISRKGANWWLSPLGDVTEKVVIAVLVEDNLYGIGVVVVVLIALQAESQTYTEIIENEVRIVIFAASQMAFKIKHLMSFHCIAFFKI